MLRLDRGKFILCDENALALALDPTVATSSVQVACCVETQGTYTRGQMVLHRTSVESNVRLVTGLDFERIVQLLTAALAE